MLRRNSRTLSSPVLCWLIPRKIRQLTTLLLSDPELFGPGTVAERAGVERVDLCWTGEVRDVRREREGLFGGERGFEGDSGGGIAWVAEVGLREGEGAFQVGRRGRLVLGRASGDGLEDIERKDGQGAGVERRRMRRSRNA